MITIGYEFPIYFFILSSIMAVLWGYFHNEAMIEREEYDMMVDPWKPILLNWAIVIIYYAGVCVGS